MSNTLLDSVSSFAITLSTYILFLYIQVFFMGMDVELLPAVRTTMWNVTERYHKLTGEKQLLVDDLHRGLAKVKPKGVQAILGITWTDLYPAEDLNFVLGQASIACRSAVMCFGRYETKIYESGSVPNPITTIDNCLIYKMIKVSIINVITV